MEVNGLAMRTEIDVKWFPVAGDELVKRTTVRKVERIVRMEDDEEIGNGKKYVRVQCVDMDKYGRFGHRSLPSLEQFRTWATTAKVTKIKQVEKEAEAEGKGE